MSGIHSVRIFQPMVLSQYLPEQGGGHSNKDIDIDYSIDSCAITGLSKSHILKEGQDQDITLDFQISVFYNEDCTLQVDNIPFLLFCLC